MVWNLRFKHYHNNDEEYEQSSGQCILPKDEINGHSESTSDSGTSSESDPDITCKQKPVVFDMNGIGPDAEPSSEDPDLISFSYTSDEEFLPAMMKKKKTVNHHQSPFTTTNSPAMSTNSPAMSTNSPAMSTNSPAMSTNSPAMSTNSPAMSTNSPAMSTNSPAMSSIKKKHEKLCSKLSAYKSSVPPSSTSSIPPNLNWNTPSKISASCLIVLLLGLWRLKSEGLQTSQVMSATAAHVHSRHPLIMATLRMQLYSWKKEELS